MNPSLKRALAETERKAWDSLARYKFLMFGYRAAQMGYGVTLTRLAPKQSKKPNPFRALVKFARTEQHHD